MRLPALDPPSGRTIVLLLALGVLSLMAAEPPPPVADACPLAQPSPLPPPPPPPTSPANRAGEVDAFAFDSTLYAFLDGRGYDRDLHWCRDQGVRDTGPFINGAYYGTHPAVRMYYSPEVIAWLEAGREGDLPDGATIVKEMFAPPAARYEGWSDAALADDEGMSWVVMIKRADAAHDGWYWGGASRGSPPDRARLEEFPPESGFGAYCLRCHASAERESTFSSLVNVAGYGGEPLRFRSDDSWRDLPAQELPWNDPHVFAANPASATPADAAPGRNQAFLDFFTSIAPPPADRVQRFPAQVHDEVVSAPGGPAQWITSDQCLGCHGGLSAPPGPTMFLITGPTVDYVTPGYNVSPYGEWRRSPMGLGGRDPIFFAQLESELSILAREFAYRPSLRDSLSTNLVDTCLSCHGVMGQRQHHVDAGPDSLFRREWVFTPPDSLTVDQRRWGGLARDGISCMACHRATPAALPPGYRGPKLLHFLENETTGQFALGPPDTLFGPFDDVVTLPMENALGVQPVGSPYVKSSRLCGSCHTINLPNVDKLVGTDPTVLDRMEKNPVFQPFNHSIEQATYLEWLNSDYQNEFDVNNPKARTCQDCHMPPGFESRRDTVDIDRIKTRIAAIQDLTYPQAEHIAPADSIRVRFREEGYARHELLGLNAFLLEMFSQFPKILGVAPSDFMTGSTRDQRQAIDNLVEQARHRTATVEFEDLRLEPDPGTGETELTADVRITNLTGHRLPSGVGFRRLFLQAVVWDTTRGDTLFASGLTNDVGVIVDRDGTPLPTEFFERGADGAQRYQPHHDVIDSDTLVQVYEELTRNAEGLFTTSFIHRDTHVKDNRLLPRGWSERGPAPELFDALEVFLEATYPDGKARQDPEYGNGSGSDVVRYVVRLPRGVDVGSVSVEVGLFSQAIPPYYLRQRFTEAPDGPATRRLYYLASHLRVDDTPVSQWKLEVTSVRRMLVGS